MKTLKRTLVLVLILTMVLCLASCGLEAEEVLGTWVGAYEYEGNSFSRAFVLDADGTYAEVTYKNGALSSTEVGTFEVKGKHVRLHPDGNTGITVEYDYKGEALVNNDHEYYKYEA